MIQKWKCINVKLSFVDVLFTCKCDPHSLLFTCACWQCFIPLKLHFGWRAGWLFKNHCFWTSCTLPLLAPSSCFLLLFPLISGILCFFWLVQLQWSVRLQKLWFSFQWLSGLYTDKCKLFYSTVLSAVWPSAALWRGNLSCFDDLPLNPHSYSWLHPVQFCRSLSQITQQLYRRVRSVISSLPLTQITSTQCYPTPVVIFIYSPVFLKFPSAQKCIHFLSQQSNDWSSPSRVMMMFCRLLTLNGCFHIH